VAVDPRHPVVQEGSRTRFLRQVFRTAPLASVRIGATSNVAAARPVAFRQASGAVAVAIRTMGALRLTIVGLPAGRYAISYATATRAHGGWPDARIAPGEPLDAAMPAAGVLSVLPR
jgi:hypothetical protein